MLCDDHYRQPATEQLAGNDPHNIIGPAGFVTLDFGGDPLEVDMTANFDRQTCLLTWRFKFIDHARAKRADKRGGGGRRFELAEADQTHPVKRRVAVKVIKAGMDSARVLTRFEAERQALALMDHPNIARVFDAGTTETGRPFFVMELCDVQFVNAMNY